MSAEDHPAKPSVVSTRRRLRANSGTHLTAKGGGREGHLDGSSRENKQKKKTLHLYQEVAYATSASDWLADSAATIRIARNKADFATYTGEPSEIEGISPNEYYVDLLMYNSVLVLQLNSVTSNMNLIRLTDKGNTATFTITTEFKTDRVIFCSGTEE